MLMTEYLQDIKKQNERTNNMTSSITQTPLMIIKIIEI